MLFTLGTAYVEKIACSHETLDPVEFGHAVDGAFVVSAVAAIRVDHYRIHGGSTAGSRVACMRIH